MKTSVRNDGDVARAFSVVELQQVPTAYEEHTFERTCSVPCAVEDCWEWLCDPATFTDGQIWPYRVEFVGGGFDVGALCNHSGPFIHFPGVITEVEEERYRDLQYLYGAYVFSFRWIRPTRLEFWLEAHGDAETEVRLRVTSFVKPWIATPWSFAQRFFWTSFQGWLRGGARKKARVRQSGSGGGR